MKKIKVIFPDGSMADVDESQVDAAISAGAKIYSGEVSTEKSTSMVFADGSIADVPADKVDAAVQAGAKKKVGGNGIGTPADINTTPQNLNTTSSVTQDTNSIFPTTQNPLPFAEKKAAPAITTPDGVVFNINDNTPLGKAYIDSPLSLGTLQIRVANKTTTSEDAQTVADLSGKSLAATQAYLTQGKTAGNAVEVTDNIAAQNQQITDGVNQVGKLLGFRFDPEQILSSAENSAQVLQSIKKIQQDEIVKNQAAVNYRNAVIAAPTYSDRHTPEEVKPLDPQTLQQSNEFQNALTENIKKLTAEEAIKKGLSPAQMGELLYKRLDPEGYAQNQQLRKPRENGLPVTNLVNRFADLITNSQERNMDAFNAERAQYELAANQGMRNLAIEKKAQGIANNDQALIQEADTIIPKIKDDAEIVQAYPMLMKQEMAQYINQRAAQEAGTLEGTDPQGLHGRVLNAIGISSGDAKRYLKEGGYYDKANFKDYADDVATHQNTYLADNSAFGGLGMSFLKPFVSLFNTVGDLTGIRTSADIHAENVRQEMFPAQLTEGVKKDVSFKVGGHEFDINVGNTLNSVSNLGGYAAIAAVTGGLGTEAGLTANAAERMASWASFGMGAVDDGLKEADKMGLSPAQAWIYSGMKAAMFAEGGRLLELDKKLPIPSNQVFNETLAKIVTGISDKTLSEDGAKEALNVASNSWAQGLLKYGLGAAKGAGVMAGFGAGDTMLKVAFGDKNSNVDEVLPEAASAYMNGLLTMGLFGSLGIKGEVDNAKNSTYKGVISKMVDNHDAAEDILKIGLDKGLYSNEYYNQKVQILNTGIKAKATLNDALAKTGIDLNPDQKAAWVANATISQSLRNQAEQPNIPETDSKNFIKQADNLEEQNSKILNGLTFNKFLEPQTELFDASTEHKQALADYAADPTSENEKILLDKKAAVDNIISPSNIADNSKNNETQTPAEGQVLNNEGAATTEVATPSIEDLRKVKLNVFDENGNQQKYANVSFEDPLTGKTEEMSAQKAKKDLENRHDILDLLVDCLTKPK